ncbi:allophanate hydrolase subunit 1 family protein, partial [Vibrio parahaemolyticus EKP-008]
LFTHQTVQVVGIS